RGADLDPVAMLEGLGLLDERAVQVGAVLALKVADEEAAALEIDLGVLAGEGLIVDLDRGFGGAADRDRTGHLDLPSLSSGLQDQSCQGETIQQWPKGLVLPPHPSAPESP